MLKALHLCMFSSGDTLQVIWVIWNLLFSKSVEWCNESFKFPTLLEVEALAIWFQLSDEERADYKVAKEYRIVQNFRGAKLSRLGHHVSIRRKTFVFASKRHPQVPKTLWKTFAVQAKPWKFWPSNVLYYMVLHYKMITIKFIYLQKSRSSMMQSGEAVTLTWDWYNN